MYSLIKSGYPSKPDRQTVYTLDEALKLFALYQMDQDIERGQAAEMRQEMQKK